MASPLTSNSEPVRAAFKVLPGVPRLILPATEDFVGYRLRLMRELFVDGAGVDEEGGLGSGQVFLRNIISAHLTIYSRKAYLGIGGELQQRRMRGSGDMDNIVESKIENISACLGDGNSADERSM